MTISWENDGKMTISWENDGKMTISWENDGWENENLLGK